MAVFGFRMLLFHRPLGFRIYETTLCGFRSRTFATSGLAYRFSELGMPECRSHSLVAEFISPKKYTLPVL